MGLVNAAGTHMVVVVGAVHYFEEEMVVCVVRKWGEMALSSILIVFNGELSVLCSLNE